MKGNDLCSNLYLYYKSDRSHRCAAKKVGLWSIWLGRTPALAPEFRIYTLTEGKGSKKSNTIRHDLWNIFSSTCNAVVVCSGIEALNNKPRDSPTIITVLPLVAPVPKCIRISDMEYMYSMCIGL